MKKAIIIFSSVLLCVYIALTAVDRSEYVVEKRAWRAQKELNEIRRDPKAVPEQRIENVAQSFQGIIQRYPNSRLVPQLYIQAADVYALGKNYEKSRESLTQILKKFPNDKELCATALFDIALTHEQENNSAQATAVYEKIIKQYPLTDIGMELYIFRANGYRQTGKTAKASEVIQDGVVFYKKVVQENPDTIQGYKALMLLSTAYMAQEKWESSVKTLGEALMKINQLDSVKAQNIVRSINTICVAKLRDYDLPIGIYEDFIKKYPGHSFNDFLKKTIGSLKLLKSKNIIIGPKKSE